MILVTGGTGLVGAHLIFELLTNSQSAIKATYREGSDRQHLKSIFCYFVTENEATALYDRIIWVQADILDIPELTLAFENITHVYHCAAMITYDLRKERLMRKINIEGTANVVNLCLSFKVTKLCYVSSIAALGKNSQKYITEDTTWNANLPHSAYAWSKYGAEMEVWRAAQEGLKVVIVNPGVILGAGFWNTGSGSLFKKVSKKLSYAPTLTTGFVDVLDVVKAMRLLMEANNANERFILVSENLRFDAVLKMIAEQLMVKAPLKPLKPWMIALMWFLQRLGRLVLNTPQTITRATTTSLFDDNYFKNNKVKTELNLKFIPISESIKRISADFS